MEIIGTAHLLVVLGIGAVFVLLVGVLAWQLVGRRGMTDDNGEYIGPPEYTSDITTSLSTVGTGGANAEGSNKVQNPSCDV